MQNLPLRLSLASRHALARQVGVNGTYHHDLHDAVTTEIRATARVVIEQCCDGVTARVELGESVNTITLAQREDNGTRLAVFIESLANDVAVPIGTLEEGETQLASDLEAMLRDAVRERRGSYYLPVEGVESLALLLRQSAFDPKRVAFRFELDGVCLTLPVLLPNDRELAYALLSGCVQEFVANYRIAA
ncbi:hypothetical protein K8374_17885 [Pseudomonas sp. p1(2021b)]|uniref:hypothetical protein n=1 Tax=Pseudomonas sp. p1(2021b) TaxID=2874628 RepID=UPI001CCE033B|nr:hypothetical protein [Pseudomonas sp. p1(2021b)]UBM24227.1 hypothetical protein K8374_17885 [Pseudomonas sp. p1(2021b)]